MGTRRSWTSANLLAPQWAATGVCRCYLLRKFAEEVESGEEDRRYDAGWIRSARLALCSEFIHPARVNLDDETHRSGTHVSGFVHMFGVVMRAFFIFIEPEKADVTS